MGENNGIVYATLNLRNVPEVSVRSPDSKTSIVFKVDIDIESREGIKLSQRGVGNEDRLRERLQFMGNPTLRKLRMGSMPFVHNRVANNPRSVWWFCRSPLVLSQNLKDKSL
jgi:hypothetical protein